MFAPALAVVFAGIVNTDAGTLDKQLKAVAHDTHLMPATIPSAQLRTLTRHGEGTRDIVAHLHVDGVIAFEIVAEGHSRSLRVVIYDGDGGLKSLSDLPLSGRALTKDGIEALRSNLEEDVSHLHHAPAPADPKSDDGEIEMEVAPPPKPVAKIAAKPAPKPAPVATKPPVADKALDAENPFGDQPAPTHAAAPVQTADDSVSVDDIEAMTGGGGGGDAPVAEVHASDAPALRLQAALGLGLASRSFTPGPSTVAGYSSSPVGAILLDANVQPTSRVTIGVVGETTLGMTTPLATGAVAATTIARWEATASYTALRGVVDVAPLVGVGRRSFSMQSDSAGRTPDSSYNYVILGATASAALGSRVVLRGLAAFEPVVSGTDPMEMTFGSASRWALDLGGSVEVHPRAHVFVRGSVNYQRFAWSWDSAGTRGAGGAVDGYPSGTLSVGADY